MANDLTGNSELCSLFLSADYRNGLNGRMLAGGQATPMSYVSDKTGKQYVVVMADGHGSLGTRMGDEMVAFALPDGASKP